MSKIKLILLVNNIVDKSLLESPWGNYSTTKLLQYFYKNKEFDVYVLNKAPKTYQLENMFLYPLNFISILKLYKTFRRTPNVIIISSLGHLIFYSILLKYLLNVRLIIKLGGVAWTHYYFNKFMGRIKQPKLFLYNYLGFKFADKIITTQDGSPVEKVRKLFKLGDKLLALPNGRPILKKKQLTNENRKNIVIVSRINYWKYIDLAIAAFELLIKEDKVDCKLDIIGDGEIFDDIKLLIKEKNLENNIIMHGRMSLPNEIFDKAGIVWGMVSYNSTVEALCSGKPCVTIDYGETPEIFKDYPFIKIVEVIKGEYPMLESDTERNKIIQGLRNYTNEIYHNYEKSLFDIENTELKFPPLWEERLKIEIETYKEMIS